MLTSIGRITLALLLFCGCAAAQTGSPKTIANMNAEINSNFQDQNQGQVTPFNTRQTLLDMVASSVRWGTGSPGLPTIATGELYFDSTGNSATIEHNAAFNLTSDLGASAPTFVVPGQFNFMECQGNNTTFVGCSAIFIQTQDRPSVTALNKGVLYGMNISVVPNFARNNSPFDDAAGLVVQNNGTGKATDAIFVGNGPLGTSQWVSGILIATNVDSVFRYAGTANYGVDFVTGTPATFNNQAYRQPNNAWSGARNAANNADVNAWRVNTSNLLSLANDTVTISPTTGAIVSAAGLTLGTNGGTAGSLVLNASTAGAITIQAGAASVTSYNFNLPTTAGTAGQALVTGGGGGTAMGWFTLGRVRACTTGVNFNSANTDNAVSFAGIIGSTRYAIDSVRITNASASISTATVGTFTATGGGGQTIATTQAITVTATATDTNNNTQALTLSAAVAAGTEAFNDSTLQVRVGTAQGSAATADVCVYVIPLT